MCEVQPQSDLHEFIRRSSSCGMSAFQNPVQRAIVKILTTQQRHRTITNMQNSKNVSRKQISFKQRDNMQQSYEPKADLQVQVYMLVSARLYSWGINI